MNNKLIDLHEVLRRLSISKTTWYVGMKRGMYPPPVQIGVRRVGWRESDIDRLVNRGV